MEPFFIGLLIGAAFAACAMYLFVNRVLDDDDELEDWSEEFYQHRLEEPRVTTRIVNRERRIEL